MNKINTESITLEVDSEDKKLLEEFDWRPVLYWEPPNCLRALPTFNAATCVKYDSYPHSTACDIADCISRDVAEHLIERLIVRLGYKCFLTKVAEMANSECGDRGEAGFAPENEERAYSRLRVDLLDFADKLPSYWRHRNY
jgi:hypothetical protein